MEGGVQRLSGFARNIGDFWRWITYASLAIATLAAFVATPSLLTQPRGWVIIGAVLGYAAWYTFGSRWLCRDNALFWRQRINGVQSGVLWNGVWFWLGLLLITLLLTALDANFRWMLFAVYGLSFSILALPQALIPAIPTIALIFLLFGWYPQRVTADDIVSFAGTLLVFVIYTAVMYLPFMLLKGRFARERMYAELERSHLALEEAHRQLAEAAEHERQFAVLRERGRLARDMHDTLGHSLALITVKLEAAQRLRSVDAARADHEVLATQAIAREALADLRGAIANLRSPVAAPESFAEALTRMARETASRVGWRVVDDVAADVGPLESATYETLLRVASEALNNAERHARAGTITLRLAREGDEVVLRVVDDGIGILTTNPPANYALAQVGAGARGARQTTAASAAETATGTQSMTPTTSGVEIGSPLGHYGITGMRERLAAASGSLVIGPGHGNVGTVVEARVPARAR